MSDSTTVRRVVVRRRTAETRRSITASSSSGSGNKTGVTRIPKKPKVTLGPRAVKVFKNRERAVIRFYVSPSASGMWQVVDAETWRVAGGTEKAGYRAKAEAIRIAQQYRDTYGAYTRSPF